MAYNESDDILERQSEIRSLKSQIADLDKRQADILTQKKFLRHRLSDLEWEMKHPDDE